MTIANFDRAIPFPSPARASRRALAALRLMGATLRESLIAYRRYEHLKTKRTPHSAALREALGISAPDRDA